MGMAGKELGELLQLKYLEWVRDSGPRAITCGQGEHLTAGQLCVNAVCETRNWIRCPCFTVLAMDREM